MQPTTSSPLYKTGPVRQPTSILMRLRPRALAIITAVGLLGGLVVWQVANFLPRAQLAAPQAVNHATESCRVPSVAPVMLADRGVQLCQYLSPADPCPIPGIDCTQDCRNCECETIGWKGLGPVWGFQEYAQGEYVGRARIAHVPIYRLRVDDVLNFVFRVTRNITPTYQINVGDEVTIESATDKDLRRSLVVLPDGTISLPLLGQVVAAGLTVDALRGQLDENYKKFYKVPAITVTPTRVDTKLEDLRYTVGGRSGFGGQVLSGRVTPEGTIQLPAVGSVPAQGLTLEEFKLELDERFAEKQLEGIEVMPVLTARAPRYVYVLGEVHTPGRYALEAPTTVMQALAMAGSWNVGANIKQIVVFRRAEDWRLIATVLDLRAALLGRRPCPGAEIWISDADLIIVPKTCILRTDNFIELLFTKGIYGIFPFSGSVSFTNLTTLR